MRLGRLLLVLVGLVTLLSPVSEARADPRWEFYTADKTRYTSPWFAGSHRIMIPFGCTRAPYYAADSRCRDKQGFHHGIDVAMECGTTLYAGQDFRVVSNRTLGPAYGTKRLLLRNSRLGWDVVIGHASKVFVREGRGVRRGWRIVEAGDSGAPDGCHLHFERRKVRGGLSTAVNPRSLLQLKPRSD